MNTRKLIIATALAALAAMAFASDPAGAKDLAKPAAAIVTTTGCRGKTDTNCVSTVQITVSADNGYHIWIDGKPYTGINAADWRHSDTFTLQLPQGDHSAAVYVEDWGGYAYLAVTIRVDGRLVSKTGDGSWLTTGPLYTAAAGRDSYARAARWQATPADGRSGLEVTPPRDWTEIFFDDTAWQVAPICRRNELPRYASINHPDWDDFDPLFDDGAKFIYASSTCYDATRTVYRDGVAQRDWSVGLFRTNF